MAILSLVCLASLLFAVQSLMDGRGIREFINVVMVLTPFLILGLALRVNFLLGHHKTEIWLPIP